MRLIKLIVIVTFMLANILYASEFPTIFKSAGDDIYKSMHRYSMIKNLEIYKDKPEFLEPFCKDANRTMQEGFILQKMQDDLEATVDKAKINSYAKSLRALSAQNEVIKYQIKKDIQKLFKSGDLKSLKVFKTAGFHLSKKMETALKPKKKRLSKKKRKRVLKHKKTLKHKVVKIDKKAYYINSLALLKEELYRLREEGEDPDKTACLNDITAINYWVIKAIKNENNACSFIDAVKQMKSYDRSACKSCGESSMRYIEWHGRIKPYVGTKLFKAESLCSR